MIGGGWRRFKFTLNAVKGYSPALLEKMCDRRRFDRISKLLRIWQILLDRDVLVVKNASGLSVSSGGLSSLKTKVATQWSELKHVYPFNHFQGKADVLSDLNNPDVQWFGQEIQCDWFLLDEDLFTTDESDFLCACVAHALGLSRLSHVLSSRITTFSLMEFAVQHNCEVVQWNQKRSLDCPMIFVDEAGHMLMDDSGRFIFDIDCGVQDLMSASTSTSLFSQIRVEDEPQQLKQFLATAKFPDGVKCESESVLVGPFAIELRFDWYKQTHNGAFDTEQLFLDVCQILRNGPPKSQLPRGDEVSLEEILKTLGYEQALHKVVDIIQKDVSYPDHVRPIFSSRLPYSDQAVFEIHQRTGRFVSDIIGYRDVRFGGQRWLIANFTKKVRHSTPWMITSLSAKDYCLLQALNFSRFDAGNWKTMQDIFRTSSVKVKINDLALFRNPEMRRRCILNEVDSEMLLRFFPWVMIQNSDGSIQYETMHHLYTGTLSSSLLSDCFVDVTQTEMQKMRSFLPFKKR